MGFTVQTGSGAQTGVVFFNHHAIKTCPCPSKTPASWSKTEYQVKMFFVHLFDKICKTDKVFRCANPNRLPHTPHKNNVY